jgi:hypothetical protein
VVRGEQEGVLDGRGHPVRDRLKVRVPWFTPLPLAELALLALMVGIVYYAGDWCWTKWERYSADREVLSEFDTSNAEIIRDNKLIDAFRSNHAGRAFTASEQKEFAELIKSRDQHRASLNALVASHPEWK